MSEQRESAIEFPCEFPIKVMGRANPDFVLRVVEIVRRHVPEVGDHDISTAASSRGNYVSVTVTVTASSQTQLDNVYLSLNADDEILMTL